MFSTLKPFNIKPKECIPYSQKAKLSWKLKKKKVKEIWSMFFKAIKENSPSSFLTTLTNVNNKCTTLSIGREWKRMWL